MTTPTPATPEPTEQATQMGTYTIVRVRVEVETDGKREALNLSSATSDKAYFGVMVQQFIDHHGDPA